MEELVSEGKPNNKRECNRAWQRQVWPFKRKNDQNVLFNIMTGSRLKTWTERKSSLQQPHQLTNSCPSCHKLLQELLL